MLKHSVACAAIAAATSAVAEEYSLAIGAQGQRADVANLEADLVGVNATYYFPPIDDTRGPYSLAPFLSRSSYVSIEAHREVATTKVPVLSPILGPSTVVFETESEGGSIYGRYVLESSGWYAGGGYRTSGGEPKPSTLATLTRTDIDIDGYSLHAGKYVGASTSLELGWDSTESTYESTLVGCISVLVCEPEGGTPLSLTISEVDEASLRVFHVGEIGRFVYSVSGRAASRRADRHAPLVAPAPEIGIRGHDPAVIRILPPNALVLPDPPPFGIPPGAGGGIAIPLPEPTSRRAQTYSAAFDVFPTARLGIGAAYTRWNGDTADDDAYGLYVDWFFMRNVALGVRLARTNLNVASGDVDDVDDIGLRLTGRF